MEFLPIVIFGAVIAFIGYHINKDGKYKGGG